MARAYMKGLIGIGLVGILAMVSAKPVSAGIDDGLVGYWSFDGNANDHTGNGHDGTVLGATPAPDAYGSANSAYAFGGGDFYVGDHIRVANDPALNLHTDFSISFWVNQEDTGWTSSVLGKGTDNLNAYFFMRFAGSNLIYFITRPIAGGPVDFTAVAVPFGEWHHVTGVYSETADRMRFYLDGVLAAEKDIQQAPFVTTNNFPLVIGRHYIDVAGVSGWAYPFKGKLDEVRIYDRALNPAEIASVYDTVPPVIAAPADVAAEATGLQTVVVIGTATATDAVGPVVISSDAPATFPLGTTTVTWTATDAAGNSSSATQQVLVKDTTAPVVTAALTAISRDRDEDEDEDSNYYRITATAADLVDLNPVVTALITQPLTPSTSMTVSYKREKKNHIQVKMEKRRLQVKLEGPSESALRALWTQVLAAGGFSVSDGQTVQLVLKKDKKEEYEAQYRFDTTLKLTSAKGPGLSLAVWATDASGNVSPRVEVAPGKRARNDRDDDHHAKLVGEGNLPASFGLEANYPNPFNPTTTLRYNLVEAGQVQLTVYNVMGQQVRVLVDQLQQAGAYQLEWDSRDQAGQDVAPGLYLYRLVSGNQTAVGKMLLVK